LVFRFWAASPSRLKRILTITVFFFLSISVTIAGILTPLSGEDSKARSEELKELRESLKNMNVWDGSLSIFKNNFVICLVMFVPVAGPLFGFYALYNTGSVVAAETNMDPLLGIAAFLLLFIFPFTWLEFISYSTAFASSVWLTWSVIRRRRISRELVRTGMFIAICAVMLLLGALIEAYLLAAFPQP